MDEKKFISYMSAAELIGGRYGRGYKAGLRRFFHTDLEPDNIDLDDRRRNDSGLTGQGFRDGEAGLPPRGTHGNAGNQNASKERDAKLHIGCSSSDKAHWVKAAQSEGLKLGSWVIRTLNRSLKIRPDN